MEDLLGILHSVSKLHIEMESVRKAHFEELDQLFFGITNAVAEVKPSELMPPPQTSSSITPQQTKKRPKRLTSLAEDDGDDASVAASDVSQRLSARMSNSQLLAVAQEEDEVNTTGTLMPPPPAPVTVSVTTAVPAAPASVSASAVSDPAAAETSMSSGRPQRAAKLRSEKNLKEPSLKGKVRRPSHDELVKVKMENEQRVSQMHTVSIAPVAPAETAPPATNAAAETQTAVEEEKAEEKEAYSTNLRVKIKREKMSIDTTATTSTLEATKTATDETTVLSTTTTAAGNNTSTMPAKKGRKKKEAHKPIKVERFSDLDKNLPVSSRTRKHSQESRNSQESQAPPPQPSIYEDAVEGLPDNAAAATSVAANETVTMPNTTMSVPINEATFNMPASNATMCLSDHIPNNATFQLDAGGNDADNDQSMKTAREGSYPDSAQRNSLLNEDESTYDAAKAQIKPHPVPKVPTSMKGIKMPARTHELFNPLLQSPVKMRVEAFENAAQNLRSKHVKDAAMLGSSTTPLIGKLPAPTLGRFLTPTQSSNALPVNSAQPKKAPMSACKAPTLQKTTSGTNLKSTNSCSSKTLTRENSNEDFRKGLHQLAEERKKQREQKHLQAAQLREAKERERAERMAKLAKEREEKRIKKQQEKEKLEERKRMEMEEIQRNLLQKEEAERIKKAKAKEQEREMLLQMKLQQLNSAKAKQMMPPPPKSKYTFEMLHEDDSTDDEGKVSYKRPPVPSWSRSHIRGPAIIMQTFCPTDVIDSFFSVAPQTPDLKKIFPNIDPSHLKRNSSVLWSTPPRYSELPKY